MRDSMCFQLQASRRSVDASHTLWLPCYFMSGSLSSHVSATPAAPADLDLTCKDGRPLAREMRPVQHGVLAKGNAALVFITGASAERASHQMASQNSVLFPIGNTTHTHTHRHTRTHTPPPPHTASETFLEKATFHLKSLPPF